MAGEQDLSKVSAYLEKRQIELDRRDLSLKNKQKLLNRLDTLGVKNEGDLEGLLDRVELSDKEKSAVDTAEVLKLKKEIENMKNETAKVRGETVRDRQHREILEYIKADPDKFPLLNRIKDNPDVLDQIVSTKNAYEQNQQAEIDVLKVIEFQEGELMNLSNTLAGKDPEAEEEESEEVEEVKEEIEETSKSLDTSDRFQKPQDTKIDTTGKSEDQLLDESVAKHF